MEKLMEKNTNSCQPEHADIQNMIQEQYITVQEQMNRVMTGQHELLLSYEQLREDTVSLGKIIRAATITDGLCRLCDLWSLINRSDDELCAFASNLLYQSFLAFGAQPIVPTPGDLYDPTLHRKSDSSIPGDKIISCHTCDWGWQYNGTVLRKAIVETEAAAETKETATDMPEPVDTSEAAVKTPEAHAKAEI